MFFELENVMKANAFKKAIEDAFAKCFDISSEGENDIEAKNVFKGESVISGDITAVSPEGAEKKPQLNLVDGVVKVDTPQNNHDLFNEDELHKAANVEFVYLQPTIIAGTENPQTNSGNEIGKNGDIYVMYEADEI